VTRLSEYFYSNLTDRSTLPSHPNCVCASWGCGMWVVASLWWKQVGWSLS